MNKKSLYTTPETELLVVRFEENIMSPAYNGDNNETPVDGGDEDF